MNDAVCSWRGWRGGLLGTMFFGGLWWTVRTGVSSQRPALWFLGSLVLRMRHRPGRLLPRLGRSLGAPAGLSRRIL